MDDVNIASLDMEYFRQTAGTDADAMQDFYLSPHDAVLLFLEREDTFVFNGFVIVLIHGSVAGSVVKINGRRYEITENMLMLIPPNSLLEIKERPRREGRHSIVVSSEFILSMPSPLDVRLFEAANACPAVNVGCADMERLLDCYDFLTRCYSETSNIYREETVRAVLYTMLLLIADIYGKSLAVSTPQSRMRHEQLSDDFFRLLSRHHRRERAVGFYADRMNLTPKYLSKAIRRITGKRVPEWIAQMVMIDAKMLLRTTRQSVLEVSEILNFPNVSTFVQYFKAHSGVTPLKYRKMYEDGDGNCADGQDESTR